MSTATPQGVINALTALHKKSMGPWTSAQIASEMGQPNGKHVGMLCSSLEDVGDIVSSRSAGQRCGGPLWSLADRLLPARRR